MGSVKLINEMLKFLKFLVLTSIFFNIALSDIIYTESIHSKNFQQLTKIIDQDSLVLINIEDNLILPKAKMFSPGSPYKNFINDLLKRALSQPYLDELVHTWLASRQLIIVEEGWPELITKLKAINTKILGMSTIDPKIYAILKDPEDKLYKELKALNIEFSEKIAGKQLIDLGSRQNRHGFFYQGLIFTGPFSKSETIIEFLRLTTLMPKKIIYIDSNPSNIKKLELYFKKFNLVFIGVNYLALKTINSSFNKQIIEMQQDTLINHNRWLEDQEAETLLQNKIRTTK